MSEENNSKEEEINSMGVEQIVLEQGTSAQTRRKQTQKKTKKEGSEEICI